MKKPALIAATVIAVAIAGWSGLWFAGRGALAERIDHEIARLEVQGVEVSHGARAIGGFPFGYQVTHRDVTIVEPVSGATYRLPEVTTEAGADDADRLITRFPAEFRVELPLSEAQRAGWPGMPEVLVIDVESSDLVLITDGVPGEGQEFAVNASSVLVVSGSAAQPLNIAVEFKSVESKGTLPALASGLPATSATTVGRLEYAYTTSAEDGIGVNMEASIDNLRVTGSSDARDQAGVMRLLGSTGTYSMAYQTGASEAVARAGLGPEQQQGSVRIVAGSTAGTLSLTNGMFELANASKANRLAFTKGPETSVGATFGGEMRAIEIQVSGPFAPSEAMVPMAFRFALDEVSADDALWQLIDAGGKLPRDPARLVIDVAGTARITGSLTDLRPGDAAPVEIGTVAIRSADISALGAGATASGDVEFQRPGNRPVGTVTVTLNKAEEMMVNLVDAGLVDPVTVQTLMLMATAFTAPGAQAGELVSKIVMSADGITVNGQPMGGN